MRNSSGLAACQSAAAGHVIFFKYTFLRKFQNNPTHWYDKGYSDKGSFFCYPPFDLVSVRFGNYTDQYCTRRYAACMTIRFVASLAQHGPAAVSCVPHDGCPAVQFVFLQTVACITDTQ